MNEPLAITSVNFDINSPSPVWAAIQAQPSMEDRRVEVMRQLQELLQKFKTVSLTECILNRARGGQDFIVELDRRQNMQEYQGPAMVGQWRLHMLVNTDGSKPKPGDEYALLVGQKTHYIDGHGKRRPMNSVEVDRMRKRHRVRGDENDISLWNEFVLDDDCCIDCTYFQAMAILTNWSELSDYPEVDGGDGIEGERRYWLFEEVDKDYKAPKKRGPKPKAEAQPEA